MPAIGRKPGPRAWPEPTGTVPRASTFRPPLHMHVFCMLYLAPDLSRRIRCEPHRAKVSRASTFQTKGGNHESSTDHTRFWRQSVRKPRGISASGAGSVADAFRVRHASGTSGGQSALLGYL